MRRKTHRKLTKIIVGCLATVMTLGNSPITALAAGQNNESAIVAEMEENTEASVAESTTEGEEANASETTEEESKASEVEDAEETKTSEEVTEDAEEESEADEETTNEADEDETEIDETADETDVEETDADKTEADETDADETEAEETEADEAESDIPMLLELPKNIKTVGEPEVDVDVTLIDVAQDKLDAKTYDAVVKHLSKFTTPTEEDMLRTVNDPDLLTETLWDGIQPVEINESTFPDPVLRAIISTADYDENQNGTLDPVEIFWCYNVRCEAAGVHSLDGIEIFVNLQGLWCKDNYISEIDVTPFKDLRGLWCSNNPISEIDISQNKELVWIYCFDCDLSELDVSHNPHMAYIEINTNPKIKSMDVTMCKELEHFTLGSCDLASIDLTHNPELAHLDIFRNPRLTKLDVTKNHKMKRLDIWENPKLGTIDTTQNPGLQYYNCASNNVKKIDLSNNPEITSLNVAYNRELTKLDISKLSKLSILHCEDCAIQKIDLTHNPYLRFFYGAMNRFTYVDFGYCPSLIETIKRGTYDNEDFHTDEEKEQAFIDAGKAGTAEDTGKRPICWYGQEWVLDFGGDDSTGGDHVFTVWLNKDCKYSIEPKSDFTVYEKYSPLDPGVLEKDCLTREIVVQTLYEMAGYPDTTGLKNRFTDVPASSPYYNAILWAQSSNVAIAMGYPAFSYSTFGLGKWCTRQDLMFMLMRYVETIPEFDRRIDFGRSDEFSDYFDVDYDHWEGVCWNATWGIVPAKGDLEGGKEVQRIDPFGIVNRNEFTTSLNRIFEVNVKIPRNSEKWNPPAAPTGLTAVSPSKKGAKDGKIKGVDKTMEYSTTPTFKWDVHKCTSNTITGLKAAVYYVRVAELDYQNPGHVAVVVVSDAPNTSTAPGTEGFIDVSSTAYYYDAVCWAAERGIASGINAKNFDPEGTCTRGQFVTFLWRFAGKPKATKTTKFSDVKKGTYYYDAVMWAAEKGITSGTGNNKFSPDAPCTREQCVTFIYRAAGQPSVSKSDKSKCKFSDLKTKEYYYNAVVWAYSKGVTAGETAKSFGVGHKCTRGQLVTFLYRYNNVK